MVVIEHKAIGRQVRQGFINRNPNRVGEFRILTHPMLSDALNFEIYDESAD